MVDAERLNSAGFLKPKHLGFITHIFENSYDRIFHLWETQKYKKVTEFIKELHIFKRMAYNMSSSLPVGPLFKKLWLNTVKLSIQSGGN